MEPEGTAVPPAPPSPPPGGWVPPLVAGAVALAAALAVLSPELGSMGGDNADYVLLARNLREGNGYRTGWGPGEAPLHTQYPPVLPLLLLPFTGGAPGSFLAAHLVVALCGAVAVLLVARLFARRGLPPWAAAAGALAPALSLFWLRCSADLLSELPYMALAAGALLALEPGGEERLPARRIAAAAALASLAFLTRTAGLALALPVAAALAADRRTRGRAGWIGAGAVLAAAGAWFLYGAAAGDAGGYGEQLGGGAGASGLPGRAWGALRGVYLPGTPAYLLPHPGRPWAFAGWVLWALALLGIVRGVRRRRTLAAAEAFLVATLLVQSAWPFLDSRFALPVAALLVPFALEGVLDAGSRLVPARPALPALALGALLLLPNAHRLFTQVLPRAHRDRPAASPGEHEPAGFTDTWAWSDGQYRQAAAPLASWLHACDLVRTGALEGLPEGHVMVSNPRIGALLTGRRAVQARGDLAPAALAALAREKGVALVLVDNFAGPPSVALRRWRDAGAGDLRSLLRLPGDVEILGVE